MEHELHNRRKRHMTEAEKSKRHEIAEAIHRDNPGMPMERKMRLATAAAMKRGRKR